MRKSLVVETDTDLIEPKREEPKTTKVTTKLGYTYEQLRLLIASKSTNSETEKKSKKPPHWWETPV